MNEKQQIQLMIATLKPIIDLIQKRMKSRIDTLNTLSVSPLDSGIPDSVKTMREEEASKIRAVIQEQADLIEIINVLYPNTDGQG